MMSHLDYPDAFHLRSAVGWLELGNWQEANEELERIRPEQRAHPDVLQVRVKIYTAAEKWDYVAEVANTLCAMLPDSSFGPLHLAHSLRVLGRPHEARAALLPVADKFPSEWRVAYQLACYSCKVGELKEALRWLEMAMDVAGKTDIRSRALDEKDLAPLWLDIAEI